MPQSPSETPTAELVDLLASLESPQRFMVAATINLLRGLLEGGETRESLVWMLDVLIRDIESERDAAIPF